MSALQDAGRDAASTQLAYILDPAEATKEPKQHKNDYDQPKNTAKPRAAITTVSVIPAPAKYKKQYQYDKNCAHFFTFLFSP
jgi:hypothetical protein